MSDPLSDAAGQNPDRSVITTKDDAAKKEENANELEELPFDEYGPPLPPDGGWGWAVVAASFLINLIVDGVCYTFGIFFQNLVVYFNATNSEVALAGSMVPGVYLIVGPIVSALANRFGCRPVAICGSLIGAFSFFICIFSPNIQIFTLTYGVMGGIGFGLMYLPSIVMVGFYFDKKRAMATGIAVCGSGIGTFLFAPLGNFLLENYGGWWPANIIISGIILHGVACALVFRPLKAKPMPHNEESKIIQSIVEEKKRRRTTSTGSLDGTVITKENRLVKEQQIAMASRDVIPEVDNEDGTNGTKTKPSGVPALSAEVNTSVASIPRHRQLERVKYSDAGSSRSVGGPTVSMGSSGSLKHAASEEEKKKELESPFARQDIFYTGSVTSLHEYKASPDMASYVQSITSIPHKVEEEEKKGCKRIPYIITQMLDFSLLKSGTFIVLCLAGVFVFLGLYTPFVYVAQKATKQLGVEESKASLIISVLGIFNTISRLIAGWLADQPWADSLVIHNVAAIVAGAATCVVPFLNSFELLTAYAAVFGTFIAAFIALRSIVLVELLGIQRLTNSFGLTALFQGIAILVGSPLSGAILDATDSYTIPFILSGAMIAMGGIVCLPARRIARWENSRGEYKKVAAANAERV